MIEGKNAKKQLHKIQWFALLPWLILIYEFINTEVPALFLVLKENLVPKVYETLTIKKIVFSLIWQGNLIQKGKQLH